jgi:hypothetical protein
MDCRVKPGNDEERLWQPSCVHSNGNRFSGAQHYLKVIKSVRLRVEALFFKGSFVAFALF